MKLFEFKTIVWSLFFVIVYLSIFVYGFIWLSNGFRVENIIRENNNVILRIIQQRQDENTKNLEERIENLKDENKSLTELFKELSSGIMPSCFRGQRKWK